STRVAIAASDDDAQVRVHAMRMLAERTWHDAEHNLAVAGLGDPDALVRRCAADALGRNPDLNNVRPLLDLLNSTLASDTHLRYAARMALRDQLEPAGNLAQVKTLQLNTEEMRAVMDVTA